MEIPNHQTIEFILTAVSTTLMLLFGHNFWITAQQNEEQVTMDLITSDHFPESDAVLKRERIKEFKVFADADSLPVEDFQVQEKTLVAAYKTNRKISLAAIELHPHPITLKAEKFAKYIHSEAAENFVKGEITGMQREAYSKFAKSLLDNYAYDFNAGHRFEIIFDKNPAQLKAGEKLPLKVLFEGNPAKSLRVSSGAKNSHNGKYAAHTLTDNDGCAEIEIERNGLCYVRTHLIRKHSDEANFEWESFWASVTFNA